MQSTGIARGGAFPAPPRGGAPLPDFARQRRDQWLRHRVIHLRRALGLWWCRILLVVLGSCLGAILGQFVIAYTKEVVGSVAALVLVFLAIRHVGFGLFMLGMCASPLVPHAFALRSLDIYPVEPVLVLLVSVVAVQAAFRVRQFVWPSFRVVWPQIGLIILALVSTIMIQVTWIPGVPRKLNSTPVVYSEILGLAMYCVPLATMIVTTVCLTGREQWIARLQNGFLVLAAVAAAIVCIEFRRIGADVYSFRYTEPVILYMQLGALAQFMGLGAIIAYARLLYANRWRMRLAYAGLLLLYLAGVYFTLENSRWLAVAVALVAMTVIFSRRLFLLLSALSFPLLPVGIAVLGKLEAVKARDIYRLTIWQDMLRVWSKRPILGVGPGNVWPYDQVFTHLPLLLRNFQNDGLGVAHNGTLQVLAEVGPLGVLCLYVFVVAIVVTAARLYLRSAAPAKRPDRILALICLGLVCGSVTADPFSGIFFLPPAQIGGFNDLPRVLTTWIMFGCLLYKDQLWRASRRIATASGITATALHPAAW